MEDTRHLEWMIQRVEEQMVRTCDRMHDALVQMEGMAHRLAALEAEVEAMKQRPGMGFRIGPETKKALIPVGIIILLALLNAPDNHIGWVISFLR